MMQQYHEEKEKIRKFFVKILFFIADSGKICYNRS